MDDILSGFRRAERAAFRTREYAAFLGKKEYARLVLHRLHRKGVILPARRGWWAFAGALPEAVACAISNPGYVSFHSGLFLHGLTTQAPRVIQVAVARNARTYDFLGNRVVEYKVSRSRFGRYSAREGVLLGFPEKCFADALMRPRSCPEIVLTEAAAGVDVGRVEELLDSSAARRRLERVVRHAGKN